MEQGADFAQANLSPLYISLLKFNSKIRQIVLCIHEAIWCEVYLDFRANFTYWFW